MNKMDNMREEIIARTGADPLKCMKCGKCSASCPSYDEMEYHPHQFADMISRGKIEPLCNSDSLYKCMSCMVCNERCPRGVKPGALVEAVRLIVIRQSGKNHLSQDKIPELLNAEMPQQAIVTAMRKYAK
ncbi:MAG: 4Fe-4S dicluster domain-containing protein [Clostridia bacterium]|jgi:heterodisulfide reductase subunit C|nr:4Fe-4S dicluster domain-containing protein [Clostridia bacterium]